MKKSPTGASIVLFSTVAVNTGMAFQASVTSAKAAVEGLTRSLAAEFAFRYRLLDNRTNYPYRWGNELIEGLPLIK